MSELTLVFSPDDFDQCAEQAIQIVNDGDDYQSIPDQMRVAAALLEKFNRLYAVNDPELGEWSPKLLRAESDYLARPIIVEVLS